MLPKLPAPVQALITRIQLEGAQGYVVGGALRDMLSGRAPKDWDIAVTLPHTRLLEMFSHARLIGGVCGTVKVRYDDVDFEITPCRSEAEYNDNRHPSRVEFVPNILTDLSRRDFTINAMAYDGQILLDPFGGREDLAEGVVRCVGTPRKRFKEDALRILRMIRLAAEFGYRIDWPTFRAAQDEMENIALISRERVREEVTRVLVAPYPHVLGPLIAGGGLSRYGFYYTPSLAVLDRVPSTPLCRYWALSALCGVEPTRMGKAFNFSARFVHQLEACQRLYDMGPAQSAVDLKQKLRKSTMEYGEICKTFALVSPAFVSEPVLFAGIENRKEAYRINHLAVTGGDLAAEGITGEMVGRMLDELLSAVIRDPALNDREILLGLLRGLAHLM